MSTGTPSGNTALWTSLNFYIKGLNNEITADKATLFDGEDIELTSADYDAKAELNVPVSYISNLFQYQTDAIDVNDINNNDLQFRMSHNESSDTTGYSWSPNVIPGEALVTEGGVNFYGSKQVKNKVGSDYLRHISKQLFNVAAPDMFSNETQFLNSFDTKSWDAFNDKMNKFVTLGNADPATATTKAPYVGGNYVQWNDISVEASNNITGLTVNEYNYYPSKAIFKSILYNDPDRFASIIGNPSNNYIVPGYTGASYEDPDASNNMVWYRMPMKVGDSMSFILTSNADSSQNIHNGFLNPSNSSFSQYINWGIGASMETFVKKYLITLKVVADDDVSITGIGGEPATANGHLTIWAGPESTTPTDVWTGSSLTNPTDLNPLYFNSTGTTATNTNDTSGKVNGTNTTSTVV